MAAANGRTGGNDRRWGGGGYAGYGGGKPGKGKGDQPQHSEQVHQGPPIKVQSLQAGEVVDVFHRYSQDPNGYFMVPNGAAAQGALHPSVGWTDCWTEARISENWSIQRYDPNTYPTWVKIQWSYPTWYNRRGQRLDVSKPNMITQRVMPEQIRQKHEPSEAQRSPCLTLFHIRWGGGTPVNPVTEGAGGWGEIGATPSDNYINGFEDHVFQTLGPTYEIISIFFQNSEELNRISPILLRSMAAAPCMNALYFMWPITFQDGHEFPAYVHREKQFSLMSEMEASGIPTRFPHASHLYRLFASKEWTAQMCLHPLLRVPLTTQVSRQAIACDPQKAANHAIRALSQLAEARTQWWSACGLTAKPGPVQKGVAKLGWSWEAMDVQSWTNKHQLQMSLSNLSEQPGSLVDLVFVQEWVDFDVEMRHFIVEPDLDNPETWKPKQIVYTVFKSRDEGSFRNFDRYDRKNCVKTCFQNDDEALADAERQAEELIDRWLHWLQGQTAELPVVCRFDIMAHRIGPGKAVVTTGELTELGGCFLGWPQGPQVVFGAMLRSCFREPMA